jgi:hypothetical protein
MSASGCWGRVGGGLLLFDEEGLVRKGRVEGGNGAEELLVGMFVDGVVYLGALCWLYVADA